MKRFRKKGFTLSELMVVLVILTIIAAIAIPTAIHYIRLAEFRKNESNAKTAYLAAESELTWYRNSGKWESFRKEVLRSGVKNQTFSPGEQEKNERIYAITLNSKRAADSSPSEKQVLKILEDSTYDKDFLSAAITVEIDIDTGRVYSAFYATHCNSLAYNGTDADGILNISAADGNREYKNRRDRYLGYYSVEDLTNVVDLKPVRLKVSTINLVNSETLSLNWSSNSRHDNLDVKFLITFYRKEGDQKLFSTTVDRKKLKEAGAFENQTAKLELTDLTGSDEQSMGEWTFPLTYQAAGNGQNARFSLVLDGMMSSDLMESLEANKEKTEYVHTYSTSITRLNTSGSTLLNLRDPQDIYAVVKAEPVYGNADDSREYRASRPVKSNDANTMFADGTEVKDGKLQAKISRFRHLSNIRYYAEEKNAEFTLIGRNLNWTSTGTGLYDAVPQKNETPSEGEGTGGGSGTAGGGSAKSSMTVQWKDTVSAEEILDFPSIRKLSRNHHLTGDEINTAVISNLHLGEASMPDDTVIEKIYKDKTEKPYTEYVGLFCEAEGKITDLTLQDPVLYLVEEPAVQFSGLYGAGILCGRSEGHLENITVKSTEKNPREIEVRLADRSGDEKKQTGIGGLVGVLAKKDGSGRFAALTESSRSVIKNLVMDGSVAGHLPVPEQDRTGAGLAPEKTAEDYAYGIGGIFGFAWTGDYIAIESCENHADVSGNLFTGGVGGGMHGSYRVGAETDTAAIDIQNCYNDGLILCTANHTDEEQKLEGRYTGGILGFGNEVQITDTSSASGRSRSYTYHEEKRDQLLGQYVGGIIGYGNNSRLTGCDTERGGYILGSDYVGGIAGGLSGNLQNVITGSQKIQESQGIQVTTNAGYVIGNRYVGGIVGKNEGDSTINNCVNQGIAAGYERYIGGIVGYNGQYGTLKNCASYFSDYNHAVFHMVLNDWNAAGDCAGGLAGYNDGEIIFLSKDAAANVKSVASIVVGKNYVGGVIGFNDIHGTLDADYTLIGGQVYADGNGAGGCIGLNASADLLKQNDQQNNGIDIRPSSVAGKYYVGGCIGVNMVNLQSDLVMRDFRTDNALGSITGEAFTGGIIGYQRTYDTQQLSGSVLEALLDPGQQWLPSIGDGNVPIKVAKSTNLYVMTISNSANTEALENANNNVRIFSSAYAGGIVGYCEQGSRLVLKNCMNRGSITKPASESNLNQGVSLQKYLDDAGMLSASQAVDGNLTVSMAGGMISANLENQVIDHCANKGNMTGFVGLGGIVGFNAGRVFHCELTDNFGNAGLDYIGGIAGLNIKKEDLENKDRWDYIDVEGKVRTYASGMIASCSTQDGRNILGHSYVGGIAGYNMSGGILQDNQNGANVTAVGDYAGGLAGSNAGTIQAAEDTNTSGIRMISGNNGKGIGGITGWNQSGGRITVAAAAGQGEEVLAVNSGVSVIGKIYVGGIAGIQEGTLETVFTDNSISSSSVYLTCQAALVRALEGYAGGIAGTAGNADAENSEGDTGETAGIAGSTPGIISHARNKSISVTADHGPAGGIVAVNQKGAVLTQCENLGNINGNDGYAGGITAENNGTIEDCSVGAKDGSTKITIRGQGKKEIGAVCAVNHAGAVIRNSVPLGKTPADSPAGNAEINPSVMLSGTAEIIGGIAGVNQGLITGSTENGIPGRTIAYMPVIESSAAKLTVGGAAGQNGTADAENAAIELITADGLQFIEFSNYQYLGGLAGRNEGQVKECKFINGTINEYDITNESESGAGAVGNCYGGIAGENSGNLEDCEIQNITMTVQGAYTALSNSTAKEKEAQASHVGGIAGKNEENSKIQSCVISGNKNSIHVKNGMAGGIVGYNKGEIISSGDQTITNKIKDVRTLEALIREAGASADQRFVPYKKDVSLESLTYEGETIKVSDTRDLSIEMSVNGNLGGIAAYNSPTGLLRYCATGNWYLNNKSDAIGVGTGGIIGMNESTENQSFLLNQAFVGRELSDGDTNRFAGGIIGNQNNTTKSGWKLQNCVNYGMIYCLKAHYSGGIIGQWTGTGGTIEKCRNYGNMYTTYGAGWLGASAGIVAQLYHAYEGNEYNIISCGNYGSIYGQEKNVGNQQCANDSAGILGNITTYNTDPGRTGANKDLPASGYHFTIQVLDCVNGSGVEIYSASMASGIVGFFSCDNPGGGDPIIASTGNIDLRIERCRNFASELKGINHIGGIFGDRYGTAGAARTTIKDCYSVYVDGSYVISSQYSYSIVNTNLRAIISFANESWSRDCVNDIKENRGNYYLEQDYYKNSFGTSAAEDFTEGAKRGNLCYRMNQNGKDYIVRLNSKDIELSKLTVSSENGKITDNYGQEVGKVLFEISGNTYGGLNSVVQKGSIFDDYVRTAYYEIEDPAFIQTANRTKMKPPRNVVLKRSGSKIDIAVTPAVNTDPFKYEAALYIGGNLVSNLEFYSENYSIELSTEDAAKAGDISVRIRACSMYDDVAPSDEITGSSSEGKVLPSPKLRVELHGTEGNYSYVFKLDNQEDYKDYGSYIVTVNLKDSNNSSLIFSADNNYSAEAKVNRNSLQQLLAQANPGNGNHNDQPSPQVSVPVYLPGYTPEIALAGGNSEVTSDYTVSGTTLEDLNITVNLKGTKLAKITTPPVYRADLIGTWKDSSGAEHKNTVFQTADILTTANGTAFASFTNLPEVIAEAADLQIRVWYAQSGLGPVYTYYPVDTETNANICTWTDKDENGQEINPPILTYGYSPVLADNAISFNNYKKTFGDLFTWLPRPKLSEGPLVPDDTSEGDNRLKYTFSWDKDIYQNGYKYYVSLTGINAEDDDGESRVSLLINEIVSDCKIQRDAEDWDYDKIELKVTRIGGIVNGRRQIGLTSTIVYDGGQRLPRPAQPIVTNSSVDDLLYDIQWVPINPETGCAAYGIYVQPYKDNGTELDTAVLKDMVNVGEQQDGTYHKTLNLEAYAGKKVLIYLVAKPVPGDMRYTDSVNGITCEVTIPGRIDAPVAEWSKSWTYERTTPVSEEMFQADDPRKGGSLKVTVTPDVDSTPPGDSSYLFKAYVFESEKAAEDARDAVLDGNTDSLAGLLAVYPEDSENPGNAVPIAMDLNRDNTYSHTISGLSAEYAGKWILPFTRISSGNGQISSKWTSNSEIWRLPYVKLPVPEVTIDNQERDITVWTGANPDLLEEEIWTADHTAFHWDSREPADVYYITLRQKGAQEDIVFRIAEDTAENEIAVYLKGEDEEGKEIWTLSGESNTKDEAVSVVELSAYQKEIDSVYTVSEMPYTYKVTLRAGLEVSRKENGGYRYTLILPDTDRLITRNGIEISNAELRMTQSADIQADAAENAPDNSSTSDAYIRSEPYSAVLGN